MGTGWSSVARVRWLRPHHRFVVSRPRLVKTSSSFLPKSSLSQGSGSGPMGPFRGSFCGKREGRGQARAKME